MLINKAVLLAEGKQIIYVHA